MAEPLPFRIDPDAGLIVITWSDAEPHLERLRAAIDQILADPDFRSTFGIVSDRRRGPHAPTPAFVSGFVELLDSLSTSGRFIGRWAAVVPESPAVFGMGRMTEMLSDGRSLPYRVFRDFDAAARWAGGGD